MDYIEILGLLVGLLILGTIVVLVIAMIRVVPADIPTVLKEAGVIVCRFMELLLPGRHGRNPRMDRVDDSSVFSSEPENSNPESVDHS